MSQNKNAPYHKHKGRPHKKQRGPSQNIREKKQNSPNNLLFGVHAVTQAWLNPNRSIAKFWVTEKALESFKPVMDEAKSKGIERPKPEVIERKVFEQRTKLASGSVHQGLCIRSDALPETFMDELLAQHESKDKACFVILDQVTDPHNVGAIMRSASAFGAAAIIMQTRHAPDLSGVLAKTACGAVDHLPCCYTTNLNRAILDFKERGYTVYGLDERGDKILGKFTPAPKSVIVLGAEGKGMRQLVRENCSEIVRLETQEPIASLNVSNAAAVALFALIHT